MVNLSQFLYFATMIIVLAITIIFMLAKDGIVRKAVIVFLLCLDWLLMARWLTLTDIEEFSTFWIIMPLFFGSLTLLAVMVNDILRKLKDNNSHKDHA